jgi:hypothetical protein
MKGYIMAEEQNAVMVDDKKISFDDLTDDQKKLLAHCKSLEQKVQSARMNLEQLEVNRKTFADLFVKSMADQLNEGKEAK